jgi:hypothetical protein
MRIAAGTEDDDETIIIALQGGSDFGAWGGVLLKRHAKDAKVRA